MAAEDVHVEGAGNPDARGRIIAAAGRLLETGGRSAVSTRAVSAAAGVQAPTIYRLFGDKQGLLHALAADGLARYLAGKAARVPSADPVADLRAGWDAHVELGLANPALYSLLYDDDQVGTSPAARAATEILAGLVHSVAEAGRLRVPERRAVQLLQASGRGTTLTLIALPEAEREPQLARDAREAVLAAIATPASEGTIDLGTAPAPATERLVNAAVTLNALVPHASALSDGERALLREWLARLADQPR